MVFSSSPFSNMEVLLLTRNGSDGSTHCRAFGRWLYHIFNAGQNLRNFINCNDLPPITNQLTYGELHSETENSPKYTIQITPQKLSFFVVYFFSSNYFPVMISYHKMRNETGYYMQDDETSEYAWRRSLGSTSREREVPTVAEEEEKLLKEKC